MQYEIQPIYVYQPYGMQDKDHWKAGLIYAVTGTGLGLTECIKGLTKEEAEFIAEYLRKTRLNGKED